MTLNEAIHARRSIRKYKKAEVTQAQIDALLEAAMLAPSANNSRPWEFVVVQSREQLDKIVQIHPYAGMLREASLAIVVCARVESDFFPQDCGAAVENILLQAVELGLGTCWCGVYPVEKLVKGLREALNIKSVPFCVIAAGVPDESPKARGFYDKERVTYIA
ncbi:MAG: nitroreductase family protein [Spirochaetaceae bacterium]|nr:nitroreductase family protein [Spirochaetaceae bacterium]